MKLRSSALSRAGGLAVATLVANWMRTMHYEIAFCGGERNDPAKPDFQHPAIFLIWHEYLLLTLYTHGFCGIKLLVSQHQDAEWLMQAARFLGYEGIRGSSNRGAVKALRQLMREGQHTSIALTPDGPLGPRRKLAEGAVFLASKTQLPIVCIGAGFERPWRIHSAWDKFAIPRPFGRARTIVSPKLQVPKKLGRDKMTSYTQYVEQTMNNLTEAAEYWADTGRRMEAGEVTHRHPRPKEADAPRTSPPLSVVDAAGHWRAAS